MTFDEVLETWRAQDTAPAHGMNQDLLELVLKHEQSGMHREFRVEARLLYGAYAFFFVCALLFFGLIFVERNYGDDPRPFWGYILALASAALSLGDGIAIWINRRRQIQGERNFGNTLRGELQRHLSMLDYSMRREGRALQGFLTAAPICALVVMFTMLLSVVMGHPINAIRTAGGGIVFAAILAVTAIWQEREVKQRLSPRQRRLAAMLTSLDACDEPRKP